MVSVEFYNQFLEVESIQEIVLRFQKTIIPTNRTAEFFVDWAKVKGNVDEIKLELSLWNSLIGSSQIENEFVNLIKKYPEVLKTLPILVAIRELEFPIINDFLSPKRKVTTLNFRKERSSKLFQKEIERIVNFARKSGIFQLFSSIRNFYDYVLGVEVGIDTNARKNRSGKAMEMALNPLLEKISEEIGFDLFFQNKFREIEKKYDTKISSLSNRKADFIAVKNKRFVNIEVNYYSGPGSKPEEIVDSYINRKNELERNGWYFIWITDGDVWRGSENQLLKAFQQMDYVLNINFTHKGMLKKALNEIFSN